MPSGTLITGRTSSITAAFVTAIIPAIAPTDLEIKTALEILGMTPDKMHCAFCGKAATEWDHLRALVKNQAPTGYITEIKNLVPACGKCNQSKGNKHWKTWILSDAPKSPKTLGVPDLPKKIARLDNYEAWGNLSPLDFKDLVPSALWDTLWGCHKDVLQEMVVAQKAAKAVKDSLMLAYQNLSAKKAS